MLIIECPHCGQPYHADRQCHIELVHDNWGTITCKLCDKPFDFVVSMKRHTFRKWMKSPTFHTQVRDG